MTHQYSSIISLVDKELIKLSFPSKPVELYKPIQYFLSLGGKRLRPALLIMSCKMFDGDVAEAIYPALGIELFHNFTLIHDDIMDNAPIRRSQKTVHEKWSRNIALLSGDAMFIKSAELISKVNRDILNQVLDTFYKSALTVCEGQQIDMNFETKNNVSHDDYIYMITAKTATLIACCLKLGSIIGRATVHDVDSIYKFGKNIGISFQLKDDLLDVYGNHEKFGKQIGGDILANKKTYLLIKATELANPKQKKEIYRVMNQDKTNGMKKVQKIITIYDELKIRYHTQEMIKHYTINAFKHLDKIKISSAGKKELIDWTKILIEREK